MQRGFKNSSQKVLFSKRKLETESNNWGSVKHNQLYKNKKVFFLIYFRKFTISKKKVKLNQLFEDIQVPEKKNLTLP